MKGINLMTDNYFTLKNPFKGLNKAGIFYLEHRTNGDESRWS